MTNANTNSRNLNALFHPAAHYSSPDDVLNDKELTAPEKRIILSSWASDMFTVESCPALREIPGMGHAIRLADVLAALRKLDGDDDPPRGGGVPMRLRRPWAAAFRSEPDPDPGQERGRKSKRRRLAELPDVADI